METHYSLALAQHKVILVDVDLFPRVVLQVVEVEQARPDSILSILSGQLVVMVEPVI